MIQIDARKCDLCGACVGVCPENVMHLDLHQLEIDHPSCTLCNRCVVVCPLGALSRKKENMRVEEEL